MKTPLNSKQEREAFLGGLILGYLACVVFIVIPMVLGGCATPPKPLDASIILPKSHVLRPLDFPHERP